MAKARQPKGNSEASTALTVPRDPATQLAILRDLEDKGRDFAAAALSDGTRRNYDSCWRKFSAWCEEFGTSPLPASPGAIAAFVTWLADGQQGAGKRGTRWAEGHKLSNSGIALMMSAIKYYHRIAGYPLSELMKEAVNNPDGRERQQWAALRQVQDGVRRTIGQSRSVRRVNPITSHELRDMIEMMRPHVLRDARDAAILAVGFGGCRRRSEVVSLNLEQRDPKDKKCRGVLCVTDAGITIKLAVSKTNQSGAEEEYVIPAQHAQLLVDTLKNWLALAKIKKGQAIFRGIRTTGRSTKPQSGYPGVYWNETRSGAGRWYASYRDKTGKSTHVGTFPADQPRQAYLALCKHAGTKPQDAPFEVAALGDRMDGQQVALIIKKRFGELLRSRMNRKKLREEDIEAIAAKVAQVSGHSMRVGHITSAAEIGIPVHQIQLSSGHKTPAMVSLYTRVTDKVAKSSLKGMGF